MAARDWSHSLASVNETLFLGLVSLDSVRSGPSNMHRCRMFPFVLARLFCCLIELMWIRSGIFLYFTFK